MQYFIKNWRTPWGEIGKALRIEMTWTQYSDGVTYAILSNTSQDLSYVKGRTILSVRKHLEECNRKLHLDTTYVQYPLRENDVSILDLVNTQTIQKVNINQKEKVNCVRVFLGVQYVSQVSTIGGTNFVPEILEEATVNYSTKQHSRNPIKKNQATAAGNYENRF